MDGGGRRKEFAESTCTRNDPSPLPPSPPPPPYPDFKQPIQFHLQEPIDPLDLDAREVGVVEEACQQPKVFPRRGGMFLGYGLEGRRTGERFEQLTQKRLRDV